MLASLDYGSLRQYTAHNQLVADLRMSIVSDAQYRIRKLSLLGCGVEKMICSLIACSPAVNDPGPEGLRWSARPDPGDVLGPRSESWRSPWPRFRADAREGGCCRAERCERSVTLYLDAQSRSRGRHPYTVQGNHEHELRSSITQDSIWAASEARKLGPSAAAHPDEDNSVAVPSAMLATQRVIDRKRTEHTLDR